MSGLATPGDLHSDANCLFCKIIAGKIPSKVVYQDDEIFAFHDINPWAPVHFLMVPKLHIPSMAHVSDAHVGVLGRMMALAPKLALQEGCRPYPQGGFRIVTNTGAEGGQEVHHLHIHVMGGPRPWLRG
jgi:histidine triad (HIT) family protein